MQTGTSVYLHQLIADGAGQLGAIRLNGARIGDGLYLSSARVTNLSGPALAADWLQTSAAVHLDQGFIAEGAGERCTIRLHSARIAGPLYADSSTVTNRTANDHRWIVDGLVYSGVPLLKTNGIRENRQAYLDLLRTGTPAYAAQAYQQLAAAYGAEGHDTDARKVRMSQRSDQIARGGLGLPDRWWGKTTGLLLGYGYQPWRALLGLLLVFGISVWLSWLLGGHGALAKPTSPSLPPAAAPTAPPEQCPGIDTVGQVTTSIEANAWRGGAGAWLSMSGLMVAAGVVLVGGATATRKASPWCWPLVLGLSVFSALCLIAHWASWPRPGAGGAGHSAIEQRSTGLGELRPEASAGPGVGLYLGILATAVAAGASFLAVPTILLGRLSHFPLPRRPGRHMDRDGRPTLEHLGGGPGPSVLGLQLARWFGRGLDEVRAVGLIGRHGL
jgi:hypothetical protein